MLENQRGSPRIRTAAAAARPLRLEPARASANWRKSQPHNDRDRLVDDLAEAGEAIDTCALAARPQPAARGAAIRVDFGGIPDIAGRRPQAAHRRRQPRAQGDLRPLRPARPRRRRQVRPHRRRRALPAPRRARAATIGDFRALLQDLDGKILPDGTVADNASVALARLRRDIERQKKSIQDSLERFLRAHREEGVLQEEFVTIRNERFVVPIIAGQRRKLDGVIHGASSSGHTLFVEPLETIDLNNELVRLTEEEAREVHRILLRDDRPPARLQRLHPADARHHGGAGADLRQSALRRRFRLRRSRASATGCC